MKRLAFFILIQLTLIHQCNSQDLHSALKSNEAYVTEQARIVNSTSIQSNQVIRKALKGNQFTIPKHWRLVSVLQENSKVNGGSEYVLFFQETNGSVHSIGITNAGSVSGNNIISIPVAD